MLHRKRKKRLWKVTLSKRSPPCFFVPASGQPGRARHHVHTHFLTSELISQSIRPTNTHISISVPLPASGAILAPHNRPALPLLIRRAERATQGKAACMLPCGPPAILEVLTGVLCGVWEA